MHLGKEFLLGRHLNASTRATQKKNNENVEYEEHFLLKKQKTNLKQKKCVAIKFQILIQVCQ